MGTESARRVGLAKEWLAGLPELPAGALLSGSSALGTATARSDIDLMLLVEPSRARHAFPDTDPEALALFEAGGLGVFWVLAETDGVELNAFAYSLDRLLAHCRLAETLVAFKPGGMVGPVARAYRLDGTYAEFGRDPRALGGGCLYDRAALLPDGRYWGGVPRQSLLEGCLPLEGDGLWAGLADACREATVRKMLAEEREAGVPAGTLSVLASNWAWQTKRGTYPEATARHLRDTEAAWRERLGG